MKRNSQRTKAADVQHVAEVLRKTKWKDIELPGGEVVTGKTIHKLFSYGPRRQKNRKTRKYSHGAVS